MIQVRYSTAPTSAETASTADLGDNYLVEGLFVSGEVRATYTHDDRMVIGGAVPGTAQLDLPSFFVAVLVVAVIALVLKLTPLESFVRATGYSESAARLAGTPVDLVKVAAFTVSGACAGLAAVMLVSRKLRPRPVRSSPRRGPSTCSTRSRPTGPAPSSSSRRG